MPRVKRNRYMLDVVEATSLKSFYYEVDSLKKCVRCGSNVTTGDVAAMGHVLPKGKQHKIIGGLLCEPCSDSWVRWLWGLKA
jgi:hypothetical protein